MSACRADGTPLIWTYEVPGAEWHCMGCGGYFGLFNSRVDDASNNALHAELMRRFKAGERGPIDVDSIELPEPTTSEDHLKCDGCGRDAGSTSKPASWYQRSDSDGTQVACSRDCISVIAELTGKTKVVLPW